MKKKSEYLKRGKFKLRNIVPFFIVVLLFSLGVFAVQQSHPLSQVDPIDQNLDMGSFGIDTNFIDIGGGYNNDGVTIDSEGNIQTVGNLTFSGLTYLLNTMITNDSLEVGGSLTIQGSLDFNLSSNSLNIVSAAGAATNNLYWGNKLVCDTSKSNCGWALADDLSNYYTKTEILDFNYYNSSDYDIDDYYLKSNPYEFYNISTIPDYIHTSNESNLNVNSSDYWDNLDTPSDIKGSEINNDLNWINSTEGDGWVLKTGDTMNSSLNITSSGVGLNVFDSTIGVNATGSKAGVIGKHSGTLNSGTLGTLNYAVVGLHDSTNIAGYIASVDYAIEGKYNTSNVGYLGSDGVGMLGKGSDVGVFGSSFGGIGDIGVKGCYNFSNCSKSYGYLGYGDLEGGDWGYGLYVESPNIAIYGEGDISGANITGGDYGIRVKGDVGIYAGGKGNFEDDDIGIKGCFDFDDCSNNYGYMGRNFTDNEGNLFKFGVFGKGEISGVHGRYNSSNYGYLGTDGIGAQGVGSNYGVKGEYNNNFGYLGLENIGVYGGGDLAGVAGYNYNVSDGTRIGVYGYANISSDAIGVWGTVDPSHTIQVTDGGVYGSYDEDNYGSIGNENIGVFGEGSNYGIKGESNVVAVQGLNLMNSLTKGELGKFNNTGGGSGGGAYYGVQAIGNTFGVYGTYVNNTNNFGYLGGEDIGVFGNGTSFGVRGESVISAVYGTNLITSSSGYLGHFNGVDYYGIYGSGETYGVYGEFSSDTNNFGYLGGEDIGVYGEGNLAGVAGYNYNDSSGTRAGVYGYANISADTAIGVMGNLDLTHTIQKSGVAVYGSYNDNQYGYLGGSPSVGYIQSNSNLYVNLAYRQLLISPSKSINYGIKTISNIFDDDENYGVYAEAKGATALNIGVMGVSLDPVEMTYIDNIGVYGKSEEIGVYGNGSKYGIYGRNIEYNNYGYLGGYYDRGMDAIDYGAYGEHDTSNNYGFLANEDYGVYAKHQDQANFGYLGSEDFGIYGLLAAGIWVGVFIELLFRRVQKW